MKVSLLTVSQRQPKWVAEACSEYQKRLPRAWQFRLVAIKPDARTSGASTERVQSNEAVRIRQALPKGSLLVALDQHGELATTEQFSAKLERWQHAGRDLSFVIGGADGLHAEVLAQADFRLSLSRMVMPHGLVRVVFVEQLYRASTVLAGHPYHK